MNVGQACWQYVAGPTHYCITGSKTNSRVQADHATVHRTHTDHLLQHTYCNTDYHDTIWLSQDEAQRYFNKQRKEKKKKNTL